MADDEQKADDEREERGGGEEKVPGAASATAPAKNAQTFKIHRVYLKDVSFESPRTPQVFVSSNAWKPTFSLQLNTESARLGEDLYESVLTVTVTVKLEESTVYLIEVKQAGLFLIRGFDEARLAPTLGNFCPSLLFSFAREEIASLVQKGGFPQLPLPLNFDALYAQHVQKARQNAPAPDSTQ